MSAALRCESLAKRYGTTVALGGRSVGQAEIIKGLAAGDVVVTAGQLKLYDGARVRLVDLDGPAAGEKVS